MRQDSGWVELLEPGTNSDVARAHLVVSRRISRGSEWEGELRSVRAIAGDSFPSGRYTLRFESGGQICCVDVDSHAEPPRVRGRELPAVLAELHASD